MTKQGLSVVTIALNEAKNIIDFIASHREIADEILVIDGGSSDGTTEIALAQGCRVINNPWPGYAKQWNLGINEANFNWILIADTDHRLTDELKSFLHEVRKGKKNDFDGFLIPRRTYFFGKWARYGGFYPDTPYPRLFKKGCGIFDEKALVHEKLIFLGKKIGRSTGDIIHLSYPDINSYLIKMNNYTSLEAAQHSFENKKWREMLNNVLKGGQIDRALLRRKLPCRWLIVFIYRYLLKLGFLDGKLGFYLAAFSAFYEICTEAKLWEKGEV